jgi:hypothetical protein
MKKTILSAAIASAIAVAAFAAPQEKPRDSGAGDPEKVQSSQAPAKSTRGTITSIDNASKSFVVRDEASGKEATVYWNASTKVNGDLKVGAVVSLEATEQSGKMVATTIEATSAKKPY